jgi:endoglucanase
MLMQACLSTGAHCIIDIHNYARFNNQTIGQGGPTNAEFANLWHQLATIYANQTRVVFGVMN